MARKNTCIIAVTAGLVCLLVYLRALSCGFVNLDDPDYVLKNIAIRHLDDGLLVWAFTNPHAGFWMPLTWISFALDYKLWGFNPVGYHLTNIVLHAFNTGLVVLVADGVVREIEEIGGRGSSGKVQDRYLYPAALLLAGLLWGLHPLRVESVAWVTERKDVLNGVFFLGSILCYLRYAQDHSSSGKGTVFSAYYFISLLLFILSLMAKSVSVVLPAMLLVADWYPLNRLQKGRILPILAEKLPFLLCSAAMTLATLYFAQQSRILASNDTLTFTNRLIVSGNAIFEYCCLIIWPAGILPLHIIDISMLPFYLLKTAIIAICCICIVVCRKRRWLVAASLCFVLPLLPVLAFFQNGIQAFASRFTYIPSVAPSIAVVFLIADSHSRLLLKRRRGALLAIKFAVALLVVSYVVITWRLIDVWNNSGTVWSRIIDIQPTGRAYRERGIFHLTTGNYQSAEDDLTKALGYAKRVNLPEIYTLYATRGVVLKNMERYAEAENDFSLALAICQRSDYYYQRGDVLKKLGRLQEADADFSRVGAANNRMTWEGGQCD